VTDLVWGPVQPEMAALLTGHPDDVPGVVSQLTKMQDVLDRLPPLLTSNPLADFNRLYLTITEMVLDRLFAGRFADPAFLARLDVEFAARYFDALRLWTDRSPCTPRSWGVLFGRMLGPDAQPLPSAAAGVNAHINFDLPFALVTTFAHLECGPLDGSDQHHDYLQINDIFAEAIPDLRRSYLSTWQLIVDVLNGELDDWWQSEAVEFSRDVAWRNAQKIWAVRHDTLALSRERTRLDGFSAAIGRLLMSPIASVIQ
jgi:hypothetical protein